MLTKGKYPVSTALYGVACIQFLCELLEWCIRGSTWTWREWAVASSVLIVIALGVLARWAPRCGAVAAGALYGLFFLLQWIVGVQLSFSGLAAEIAVIVLLLYAAAIAFKRPGTAGQNGKAHL